MIVIIVYLFRRRKAKKQANATHKELRIPVTDPVQARPSQEASLPASPSYADRVRPAVEEIHHENTDASATLPPQEEVTVDPVENVITSDTTAEETTCEQKKTESPAETNPRLLAFEQLMKDLGGRIE